MKICWDNLEKLRYNDGRWIDQNGMTLYYRDSCLSCGDPFLVYRHHFLNGDGYFCSKSCAVSGENHGMYGKKHTKESLNKMSQNRQGKLLGDDNPMRRPEMKKLFSDLFTGEGNPNWKGGKKYILCPCGEITTNEKYCSPECCYKDRRFENNNDYSTLRCTFEYKIWRKKVFERDNYTCGLCKIRGGKLEGHHIQKVAVNPELIFDVNNGITLCVDCHNLTKNKEGLYEEEFKNCIVG